MSAPSHADRLLFVNLPVADLDRTKAFFAELGFGFDPQVSGDGAACMQVGEQANVMLLERERFAQFAKLPVGDPRKDTQVLLSFSVAEREDVNAVVDRAIAAGGAEADAFEDHGFMCSRAFFDLDGNGWNVVWMDAAAFAAGAAEAEVTTAS